MFRVLVVDDQHGIHDAFRKILTPEERVPASLLAVEADLFGTPIATEEKTILTLTHANSGEEGVTAVREMSTTGENFAVAFVDMRMPGIDGIETARQIWMLDPNVQIIFCTAHADHGWSEFAALGPLDRWLIIKKDFDPIEVKQVAHAMCAKWQIFTELRVAREAAEVANREKSDFLANMSHELRTPNHAIGSFTVFVLEAFGLKINEHTEFSDVQTAEILERFIAEAVAAASEAKLAEFLHARLDRVPRWLLRVHRANAELIELLNSILDLAKLESGRMDFSFQHEKIDEIFRKIVESFESLCTARGLTLEIEIEIDEEVDLTAEVDTGKIAQVFRNLLGNAVKFSPAGSTLIARFAADESSCAFSLTDRGPGIPSNELEKIFDKFFQSTHTANGAGGTGLGLPLCREYISRHGGKIWAENNADGGSTFFVELPRVHGSNRET